MKLLITFIIVSAINVIFSTTRQILTVNGGKWVAALACAIYNAFNNILVIYTVADFPLGAGNTEGKIAEAKKAIADGADEIDMMAKISAIKNHEYHDVRDDIKAVKEAIGDTVLKVIIECPVLTMDEIAAAAAMCEDAGADYVKTASGFNGNQDFYSLMESLRVIKKNAPHCKMKAAGGINNYKLTTNIIAAGVEKIGSSNPLPIIDELNHVAGNQKVAPGTVKGPRLI